MKHLLFALALTATAAQATEAIDAGGTRSTSTSYTIDASLAPGAVSTSGNHTVKSGYIGQLIEPLTLQLAADPPTIDETTTRQIEVTATLDDGTTLTSPPPSIFWLSPDLPLTVDTNALATAAAVYQDTPGTLHATLQGLAASLPLTVLDTDPDNFPPYAGDTIDDAWQVLHFGDNNLADAAPGADPDTDTQTNLDEFLALTDPTDPTSFLDVRLAPDRTTTSVIIDPAFPALRTYTVLTSPTPDPTTFQPLPAPTISDDNGQRTVTHPTTNIPRTFYRLHITIP